MASTTNTSNNNNTHVEVGPSPSASNVEDKTSSSTNKSLEHSVPSTSAAATAAAPTSSNKENSANAAAAASSSSLKRPATASSNPDTTACAAEDTGAAAVSSAKRTKTTNPNESSSSSSNDKKATTNNAATATASSSSSSTEQETPLDLAVTLGYKPGDRIEVQWEVENTEGEIIVKWWGASLLPFDGRTTDSVAIRTLHYDVAPDLGFSETSDEDVIFLGHDLLVTPDDSQTQLTYRKEGDDEEVFWLNEQDMDEQLNAILMGALSKNQAVWQNLPAAQQALIAEKIKTKKDELLKVLKSKKEVITSSSIKEILKETFGGGGGGGSSSSSSY